MAWDGQSLATRKGHRLSSAHRRKRRSKNRGGRLMGDSVFKKAEAELILPAERHRQICQCADGELTGRRAATHFLAAGQVGKSSTLQELVNLRPDVQVLLQAGPARCPYSVNSARRDFHRTRWDADALPIAYDMSFTNFTLLSQGGFE
ncbi:unnamed protein product [Effrenium voratum]|uniref:Uncharacterized protein n=1 Tax=Effrenium voratum TaxID=2562239 RepID=A0AA36HTB2_9DINO|nr:unnamed protein product [Effrenium voratum]